VTGEAKSPGPLRILVKGGIACLLAGTERVPRSGENQDVASLAGSFTIFGGKPSSGLGVFSDRTSLCTEPSRDPIGSIPQDQDLTCWCVSRCGHWLAVSPGVWQIGVMRLPHLARVVLCVCAAWSATAATPSASPNPEKKKEQKEDVIYLNAFTIGVTPGGLKDVNYARELLKYGMLPMPGEFSAEGLLSEHDLPAPNPTPTDKLIQISGAAKPTTITGHPDFTQLVQIGFSSRLTFENFKRDPLYLVLVLDLSGSMRANLPLLKQSVETMIAKLRAGDALAVVTFSNEAETLIAPTRFGTADRAMLRKRIRGMQIIGGTNIEAGLARGFALAASVPPGFAGRKRVVLITDAMPNIGETGPDSFMTKATDASLTGVGLTTIGLGVTFDSSFVRKVSSVSGGNAFWFGTAEQMNETLGRDFDFMVTEVAHDLKLEIAPSAGLRVAKVYGLPGDAYAMTPDGGIVMDVPTLFLSRNSGAIFVALSGTEAPSIVATAHVSYLPFGDHRVVSESLTIYGGALHPAPVGVARGEALISEFEALEAAGHAFYESDRIGEARTLTAAAAKKVAELRDSDLGKEGKLLQDIASFLEAAERAPRFTGTSTPKTDDIVGAWTSMPQSGAKQRWFFLRSGKAIKFAGTDNREFETFDWNRKGISSGDMKAGFVIDGDTLAIKEAEEVTRLERVVDRTKSPGAAG
jgi:Ca-activated chloride channel homolog